MLICQLLENVKMKLIKVIDYKRTWVSKKDGKERPSVRIYLVINVNGNETWVAIGNPLKDYQRNWAVLESACEVIIQGKDSYKQ